MTDQNNEYEYDHESERAHEHGYGQVPRHGGWEPVPHGGEYEPDATAFVQLPPDMDMMGAPLAAPGHGYVPPMIVPLTPAAATDPAATGVWRIPTELTGQTAPDAESAPGAQTVVWPEPAAPAPLPATPSEPAHDPTATAQWNFADEPSLAGTGQWTIPVAEGELPEESGEFTTSSLIEQWGSTPPATLPGGAPAPWANHLPDPEPQEPAAHAADLPAVRDVPEPVAPADAAAQPHPHPEPRSEASPEPAPHPEPEAASAGEPLPRASAAEEPAAEAVPEAHAAAAAPEAVEAHEGREAAPTVEPAEPVEAVALPEPRPESEPGAQGRAQPHPEAGPETEGATPSEPVSQTPPAPDLEHTRASYVLRVNGADRPVTEAWVGESLLYVLRERLGLAGAKDGCSQGECGACNVQVDGRLVASCLVPAATTAGSEVRTVEGLATDGEPSDVQRALAESGAVQCGFCIPGMAMTVHDLLEGNHAPTELETRQALCGNLCRCSGYRGVLDAVKDVVAGREAAGTPVEEARIPHQAPPGAGSAKPPHTHDGGMA
ncbi:2Fe-2S iron-sulfur cluster-binding protein [Streptomyces sp. NPDC001205]